MNLRLLLFLLLLAETSHSNYLSEMLGLLSQLVYLLIIIVAPLLLLYGFMKGTLDVLPSKRILSLSLLVGQSWINQTDVTQLMSVASSLLFSLFFIIIPFLLMLILWKSFTKMVKL